MSEKVAIVTGASRGLGKALTHRLCSEGYMVAGFARNSELLSVLEKELSGKFIGISVDVTDAEAMNAAITQVLEKWGRVDLAIANAGVAEIGWASKQSTAQIQKLFSINFMGMVHLFTPLIPSMLHQKSGHLVGIASIAAFRGFPTLAAYSASKAAMQKYLEALRVEFRSKKIMVSTICPGYIDTDMTAGAKRFMPFIISADKAAQITLKAIDKNCSEYVFPFPMAIGTKILSHLPNTIYDRIAKFF